MTTCEIFLPKATTLCTVYTWFWPNLDMCRYRLRKLLQETDDMCGDTYERYINKLHLRRIVYGDEIKRLES
jgi:hypothetical protein